jgi:hypothetical protein
MIHYIFLRELLPTLMKLVTFQHNDSVQPGILSGGGVIGLAAAGFDDSLSVIAGGAGARASPP